MAQRVTTEPVRNEHHELPKTSRGTLMGSLLRRFWQPVAASTEVPKAWAIPIRIMGEDLTLYRGESGTTRQ